MKFPRFSGFKYLIYGALVWAALFSGANLFSVRSSNDADQTRLHLPLVLSGNSQHIPQVNAPYMDVMSYTTSAVFWFGRVTSEENYADVRVGYNQERLWMHIEIFDRRLWYDPTPEANEFSLWDSVSIYLETQDHAGPVLGEHSYRFDGMLNWWEPRESYQASYAGGGSGWIPDQIPLDVITAWRGNQPNDAEDDRGWIIVFQIPFSSLGMSAPPTPASIWQLGISLYDRDGALSPPNPSKTWPPNLETGSPNTWGLLKFGMPTFSPQPGITPQDMSTIRHKLSGAVVTDAMVGGGFNCGEGLDYWTVWGQTNYAGSTQVNVQNEFDVSDWPCFSKYFIDFPLASIPVGKQILSATLTLYQIGNTGGGVWGPPGESVIQVLTTRTPWEENTISWNNAPMAFENVSMARVDPTTIVNVPREWDVSYAVNQAYSAREDLRLVLYSADGDYNTGRYFNSSDLNDYQEIYRPTLSVSWGNP